MTGVLLGALAALGYGTADFVARFTARELGPPAALLGALGAGSAALTLYLALTGGVPLEWWSLEGLWLLPLAGLLNAAMLLLLYQALARGPVTIAAPIVGAYPALVLILLIPLTGPPRLLQWGGLAITLAGVVLLSRGAGTETKTADAAHRRGTIALSAAAAGAVAAQFVVIQEAAAQFGPVVATWASRVFALLAVAGGLALQRVRPKLPTRWWPALGAQGLLDAGAVLAIALGSSGPQRATVAIVTSGFSAVTVVLARLFLREAMNPNQWVAIILIVGGVGVLSTPSSGGAASSTTGAPCPRNEVSDQVATLHPSVRPPE